MSTVAIIAEYNPFHNGHSYQLKEALRLTGATNAISIMSGNFLQRGDAAIWDKYNRARLACQNGLDLVIELPFPYATGSARDFAYGAISTLNALNYVDYLCFGAENSDLQTLTEIADILVEEPVEYKEFLKAQLSSGLSYPASRSLALSMYTNIKDLDSIMNMPNNILAIEYLCALKRTNSSIKPVVVKRVDLGYHSNSLENSFASASAIRNAISKDRIDTLEQFVSKEVYADIMSTNNLNIILDSNLLTPWLQQKLICFPSDTNICDMPKELSNRLSKLSPVNSYDTIVESLKSKNYTTSRISRALIHLLFDYTEEDRALFVQKSGLYANVLSFKKASSPLLKEISEKSIIPLIVKKASFEKLILSLPEDKQTAAKRMWELDTKATEIYNCLVFNKYGLIKNNDYQTTLPIV